MKIINKSIDAVTWTDFKGHLVPMKIRIKDKNNLWQVYDVTHVNSENTQNHAGNMMVVYDCDLDIDHRIRTSIIRFERDTSRWILFKVR